VTIVDSTVWVDYLAGTRNAESDWLDAELSIEKIGLTDLILCEVLQGIRSDEMFKVTRQRLHDFEIFSTGGTDLATASAHNYRVLRARGYTVRKTIDCLIATFCIENGHALLHRDRDFGAFERHLGLRVIHP
jgi:hypothetical protein